MLKIIEYKEKYAKEMSEIIITNMYEINIKDHGKEQNEDKEYTLVKYFRIFKNITKIMRRIKLYEKDIYCTLLGWNK